MSNNNPDNLITALQQGNDVMDQLVKGANTIQIAMANTLIGSQHSLMNAASKLANLEELIIKKLVDEAEVDIQTLTDVESKLNYLKSIHSLVYSSVDMQRKIVQGKQLLTGLPTMTDEERGFLQLMRSLKSDAQKQNLMSLVKQAANAEGPDGSGFTEG